MPITNKYKFVVVGVVLFGILYFAISYRHTNPTLRPVTTTLRDSSVEMKKNTEIIIPTSTLTPTIFSEENFPQQKELTSDLAAVIPQLGNKAVTVTISTNSVKLRWQGTGVVDTYYNISRKSISDKDWQKLDKVEMSGDNTGWYEWIDVTAKSGVTYRYGVVAAHYSVGGSAAIGESDPITAL